MASDGNYTEIEPTIQDLILSIVRDETQRHHGLLPCEVLTYNAANQTVKCLPLIRIIVDGEALLPPHLTDVPVVWPSGATWSITGPLFTGDRVMVVPAGGDISQWWTYGTKHSTQGEPRRFNLSDVVAFPGGRELTKALTAAAYDATAIVLAGQIKLGDSTATRKLTLDGDQITFNALVTTWMGQVETAVNTLAPGAILPLSTTFTTYGTVSGTSTKAKAV